MAEVDDLVRIAADSIEHDLFDLRQKEKGQELFDVRGSVQDAVKDQEDGALDTMLSTSLVGDEYVPPDTRTSKTAKKKQKKEEAQKTAGPGWFNLPATSVTPELRKDLQVLQMRNYIFKDKFYKKADPLPKYFQVGTVVESSADFYSSRLTRKQRANTFVDELLKDSEFKKYTKKKFMEIKKQRASGGKVSYRNKVNKRKPIWKRK
uniref:Fcf2 pre-rRNA processing C-terminal domain-containing protein n=1 Tax=Vannella robusta TaxID=1487602 RepID=A0A7S4MJG8_9EUKA|mmetsp:Transcript_23957/g.30488  ORF Transcript_23957/g.30488 Transcript_23957/m.30488 type:complete len:206 (+) Transcript_23957:1296-1913(+)|eukprot:CAMPEP_0206191438 /NCGR_PEP_ID=MMETSP0166-20121206/5368_1 /ASSEMBLY_ACC=CAM_ASM_000260 /TAXON_ID=95228 /ORGANISM="Vannella robusta, Strain DIVA3 518/3/11/1/6" /LENGTH=205 /DNA_ID=CAMNT_0053607753 /DNA_START=1276 /DNA_END=1893 /DNA_ORIENTATION=+